MARRSIVLASLAAVVGGGALALGLAVPLDDGPELPSTTLRVHLAANLEAAEQAALAGAAHDAGFEVVRAVGVDDDPDASVVATGEGGVTLAVWVAISEPFAPVTSLTSAQLEHLMTNRGASWADAGGASIAVRALNEWPPSANAAHASYASVIREASATPGSLAIVPLGAVNASVRIIAIDGVDPVQQPDELARYPLRRAVAVMAHSGDPRLAAIQPAFASRAGVAVPKPVHLVALGTTLPARCAYARMRDLGDYTAAWHETAAIIRAADIAIANLEAVPSDLGTPFGCLETTTFLSPAATTDGFAFAGLDIVSLANNHSRDYGPAVLLDGIANLRAAGIAAAGAGADAGSAAAPLFVDAGGLRFAFLAYDDVAGLAYAASDDIAGTNPLDEARMVADIRAARAQADAVIVMIQWGIPEYYADANERQRALAAAALRAGATYVYGDGPHVPQGLSFAGEGLVQYSLGNFIFDQDWCEWTSLGAMLRLTWSGDRLVAFEFIPYRITDRHRPVPLAGDEAASVIELIASATARGPGEPPRLLCEG